MDKNRKIVYDEEIDLIDLIRLIWSKKAVLVRITSAFVAMGLLIAFTAPKEYRVSSSLISEAFVAEGQLGGSLGGLASLAGIDFGNLNAASGTTINPALYKGVAQSTPFLLRLMEEKYYFQKLDQELSVYDYYLNHYETGILLQVISIPLEIINWLKSFGDEPQQELVESKFISLTEAQQKIIEDLRSRIFVTMDWELNIVTIDVEMQDPFVAAEVAKFTEEYIKEYATNYAISKSRKQLEFVEAQFLKRRQEFEDIQIELATFRDQNQFVSTARARSEEERIQSRYNLAFDIYSQLAQKVETIKLQIDDDTPVFSVLEPITVPVEKSKPKRTLMLLVFMFIGTVFSIVYILLKNSLDAS